LGLAKFSSQKRGAVHYITRHTEPLSARLWEGQQKIEALEDAIRKGSALALVDVLE
jgi:hypothetical protein